MEIHTASSEAPPDFRLEWDVFLSFRGGDTRGTFTEQLYSELRSKGVRVFRDNEGMNRGDEIQASLLSAIDDSAAAIAVISPDYASSHWCLEELARLCDGGKRILPVFYRVNPSDVRHQRGTFANAFVVHERRFGKDIIESWRRALTKAGGLSGWVVPSEQDEQPVIQITVQLILELLSNSPLAVAPVTVGLDSRVRELLRQLDIRSNDAKILVLHGMGGIGKTTLAKALYNRLVAQFKARCFIPNIRETSTGDNGLINVQNKLLEKFSPGRKPINDINDGRDAIRGKVQEAQILLVLDDVDDLNQLDVLIGKKEWFHDGSRIIITTRERRVLSSRYVTDCFEVRELNSDDALKLFSYHALKREKPTDSFFDLSKQIVSLTGGLPLALEVFGSFLIDKRSTKEWEEALRKLKTNTLGMSHQLSLQGVLKISYDGLDEQNKSIFLDIACLFAQMDMTVQEVVDVLDGCGYDAKNAIKDLREKSLVKIIESDTLWIHDQLRDMGRDIVRSENHYDPGRRSRLWHREEILSVLKDGKGTRDVQGIVLEYKEKMPVRDPSRREIFWSHFTRMPSFTTLATFLNEICKKGRGERGEEGIVLRTTYFQQMINLRLLQINRVKLEGEFRFLPQSLKWLQWRECPLRVLLSDFCPRDFAVLDLSDSTIEQLWRAGRKRVAENLKTIILRGCHKLVAIPDLSGSQKLEKVVLEKCTALTELHKSVGQLGSLRYLNLRGCSKLAKFPTDVSGLKCLENLILSNCALLEELPEGIGLMKSLKELLVDGTAIRKLPDSLFHLEMLEKLELTGCSSLQELPNLLGMLHSLKEIILDSSGIVSLPDSIGSLGNLETLSVRWCTSLTTLPSSIGDLTKLKDVFIGGSNVRELPASIRSLRYLRELTLGNCEFSRDVPDSVEGLISLLKLDLGGESITSLPNQIGSLKMLKRLEIWNCPSLETLPESIGSLLDLTTLFIINTGIKELPESVGNLEDLVFMKLNKCRLLQRLPASFGKLKSLHHLSMEDSGVVELPDSFAMLSNLVTLNMGKKPQSARVNPMVMPSSVSKLTSLVELKARACYISGGIPNDFEKLVALETLDLGYNNFDSLPSSLKGLSSLKCLLLPHCSKLKSLPPLPSRLENIDIAECRELEIISDLSNLKSLQELNMPNCGRVVDVPGIQCLESLGWLYMTGCNMCSLAVKRRLSKEVTYKALPNRPIKAVLVGIVVSVNSGFPEELTDCIPTLADIQATILMLDKPLFSTSLPLKGIPKANEEQVHFCRFLDFHPLVSKLKDGYRIRVELRDPPMIPGTELKKCGVFLVSDMDDDYGGDETPLSENQQSLSEKLARFFNSLEDSSVQSPENAEEGEASSPV
ncbi:hypothetical protein CDL15_Pgr009649 [Punica granatum]|uniref:TIR domain-containing protein n=1 Tax=Punica granatum TaxID=22663 RepID=A0A218WT17_PUNGR|nr:hypothetical protein CDL15_Pgr009649 [Punica granatum]